MTGEYYKTHRPERIEDVVGQAGAVKTLRSYKKIPQTLLFHGPSGTGKTTLARALARELGCPPEFKFDYSEINCATVEPLETVREIQAQAHSCPLSAPVRVWVLDEVQSLSRARFAQEGLLKVLEDGAPSYVHFFLCTTDPKKILPTVRGRCHEIAVKPVPAADLSALVCSVAKKERISVSDELVEALVEFAGGSARRALVELEKVAGIAGDDERLAAVGRGGVERQAFDLAKALLWSGRPVWKNCAAILTAVEDESPEGIRQLLLACARGELLKKGAMAAYEVINCLDRPLYDENKAGHAVLAARVFEMCNVLNAKK